MCQQHDSVDCQGMGKECSEEQTTIEVRLGTTSGTHLPLSSEHMKRLHRFFSNVADGNVSPGKGTLEDVIIFQVQEAEVYVLGIYSTGEVREGRAWTYPANGGWRGRWLDEDSRGFQRLVLGPKNTKE